MLEGFDAHAIQRDEEEALRLGFRSYLEVAEVSAP